MKPSPWGSVRGPSWLAVAEQPARRHAVASAIAAALWRVRVSPSPSALRLMSVKRQSVGRRTVREISRHLEVVRRELAPLEVCEHWLLASPLLLLAPAGGHRHFFTVSPSPLSSLLWPFGVIDLVDGCLKKAYDVTGTCAQACEFFDRFNHHRNHSGR